MLNGAQEYITQLLTIATATGGRARYLAPHAPRGTMKRGHLSRKADRALSEKLYREGLMKPQDKKYWNLSKRRITFDY